MGLEHAGRRSGKQGRRHRRAAGARGRLIVRRGDRARADATSQDLGLQPAVGGRSVGAEPGDVARGVHGPDRDRPEGIGRWDEPRRGRVRVVAFVARRLAHVEPVGGRDVEALAHHRGFSVEVVLGVVIENHHGRGGDVSSLGLDELESGDEQVLLGGVLRGHIFHLGQDVGGVVGGADERARTESRHRAENVGAVIVLIGQVAGLRCRDRVVVQGNPTRLPRPVDGPAC